MKDFTPTPYTLECVATGREFEDTGWMLADPQCKTPSLVRAKYARRQLEVKPDEYGFYKFCDWLPVRRMLKGSSAPVTYKSKGLARHLGLENLYITFNGYYPAIGATMSTCSFKETEAFSVCARAAEDEERVLVVASAGNTARAFAKVCSDNHIKLLLSVPYDNIEALWFEHPLNPCVKLISCEKGGDYFDAIHLSDIALKGPGFYAEGGAKNIARRDGMATTVLSAVTTIGRIPDYYFQAVGSGTGAIAAWEANMRLIEDGRFGSNTMKLMVSQNAPFVPMYDAWQAGSRKMLAYEDDKARRDAEIIDAKVLSNRRPPYGITGGLYDALKATGGEFFVATNAMARKARKLFKELEGVDIYSASGIALASLVNAVAAGKIEKDAVVMLNITGARLWTDFDWAGGTTSLGGDYAFNHIYSTNLGEKLSVPHGHYTHAKARHTGNVWLRHAKQWRRFDAAASAGVSLTPYGTSALWNVSGGWRPAAGLRLAVGASQSMRLPTFTDLYYSSPAQINNLDLIPEKAVTYRIEADYVKDRWNASLRTYYRAGRDIIDWVWREDMDGKWHSEQTSRLDTYGVELTGGYAAAEGFLRRATLSYGYITTDRNTEVVARSAMDFMKHKAALAVEVRFLRRMSLALTASVYDRNGSYTDYPTPGDASVSQVRDYEPYFLLDGRLSWEKGVCRLYVDATNITDTRYCDLGGIRLPGAWVTGGVVLTIGR